MQTFRMLEREIDRLRRKHEDYLDFNLEFYRQGKLAW